MADASALVRAVADKTWVTDGEVDEDVPDIVVSITLAAAKRAFVNPDGERSVAIDGYSTDFANASPDVYLTAKEESRVRSAAGTSGGRLWTQETTRSDTPDVATVFLDVEPPGEPMPWGAKPDPY